VIDRSPDLRANQAVPRAKGAHLEVILQVITSIIPSEKLHMQVHGVNLISCVMG